ncbi:hypothetical protein RFI_31585 [Reticulomyxa filosa]|uniref:Uncharacterized protein n=1 Tax=Reticulomyxa filosa TaxID=46433 RepID=X6LWS6_RETFI|nr:hypothetical protein RFI_31585 [Reticulomyxa filosa]|eukprot:ETO05811.1 hypothetical protein RFI_31585 [Reticulomyxa filosa]
MDYFVETYFFVSIYYIKMGVLFLISHLLMTTALKNKSAFKKKGSKYALFWVKFLSCQVLFCIGKRKKRIEKIEQLSIKPRSGKKNRNKTMANGFAKLKLKIALPGEVASIESPWIQKLRQYDLQHDPKIYAFAESLYSKLLHFPRSHSHMRRHCRRCISTSLSSTGATTAMGVGVTVTTESQWSGTSTKTIGPSYHNSSGNSSPTKSIHYHQKCIPMTPTNEKEKEKEDSIRHSTQLTSHEMTTPIPMTPSMEGGEDFDAACGHLSNGNGNGKHGMETLTPVAHICCYYNLLFLDADGVIVPTKSLKEFPSEEHMARLKSILDQNSPELSVIISSSWRSSPDHLYSLCAAFKEIGIDYQHVIIGCIPSCKDESFYKTHVEERNACIQAWFSQMHMDYVDVYFDPNHTCYANQHLCKGHPTHVLPSSADDDDDDDDDIFVLGHTVAKDSIHSPHEALLPLRDKTLKKIKKKKKKKRGLHYFFLCLLNICTYIYEQKENESENANKNGGKAHESTTTHSQHKRSLSPLSPVESKTVLSTTNGRAHVSRGDVTTSTHPKVSIKLPTPTITISNISTSTAKAAKPARGKPRVLEDSDNNDNSTANEPATSNTHNNNSDGIIHNDSNDNDNHDDDEKHVTNGGPVSNVCTLVPTSTSTLSPAPCSSTKRIMKVWRSKAQNFNVYNYLIVDDFGLSGPMIDGHFLRTQPSVGMTEYDKQTILTFFKNPPPSARSSRRKKSHSLKSKHTVSPIKSAQSHDHNLHLNHDHDHEHDHNHNHNHNHGRKHTHSKLSTSTITPHPVDDSLNPAVVLQHQNSDVDRRAEEGGEEEKNGPVDSHDDDDEEEQEWEDESSEGTRERNALLANIDPDILMMIPSAQD